MSCSVIIMFTLSDGTRNDQPKWTSLHKTERKQKLRRQTMQVFAFRDNVWLTLQFFTLFQDPSTSSVTPWWPAVLPASFGDFWLYCELHNIIEPERNPAEYYHTMVVGSVAPAGSPGQKNTTTAPRNKGPRHTTVTITKELTPYQILQRFILVWLEK